MAAGGVDAAFDSAVEQTITGMAGSFGRDDDSVEDAEPGMKGRLVGPPKFGWWLRRNWWRLLGVPAACWWFALRVGETFPFAALGRGAASYVSTRAGLWAWRPEPSRFDECWAGRAGPCAPELAEWVRLGVLAATCAAVVVVWWRCCELPAGGGGPVGRWCTARRRGRVLAHVRRQCESAAYELGFAAPPTRWEAALSKVGVHPKRGRPQAELSRLRMDMAGGVVADLKYARLADVALFEKERNVARLRTAMAFETGHRRRIPRGGRAPRWVQALRGLTTLRPVFAVADGLVGEKRFVLTPSAVTFDAHDRGGQWRTVRFNYPNLGAEMLVPDTEAAPDHSRVRLALGVDVHCWDRDEHPHLGVYGPTRRGKGHVLRRVVWQVLQLGQMVVLIDGQAGSEHSLFQGLPNYWWFDPEAYQAANPAAPAGWVLADLPAEQRDEVLGLHPEQWEQVAHLVYVLNQLMSVAAVARGRMATSRRNLGQDWHEWSAQDRAANPRINVVVDEANTLLGKGNGPGKVGEELRRKIGAMLGVLLFGAAKNGVHVVISAQILYAGSWMAKGMYAQMGQVVAVGNVPAQHQIMTTQVRPWPDYPDEKGYGIVAAYAHPPAVAVRFPPAWPRVYAPLVADLIVEANGHQP